MTLLLGDCLEVMPTLEAGSVDAVVTDPPYGIGFMGKAWDAFDADAVEASWSTRGRNQKAESGAYGTTGTGFRPTNPRCGNCGRAINGRDTPKGFKVCHCAEPVIVGTPNRDSQRFQAWNTEWATEAFRVAKPGAYLLAFGGTRTYHRLTCAIEDAGWIIRDCLVWAYASGFPKSRALLKPAWEPIVMARKPGPLRELAIDRCRIGVDGGGGNGLGTAFGETFRPGVKHGEDRDGTMGRWPSNILLTADEDGRGIFDGDTPGVVGGGEVSGQVGMSALTPVGFTVGAHEPGQRFDHGTKDSGTYSRFFLIPKSARSEREPVLGGLPESTLVQTVALGEMEYATYPDGTRRIARPKARANHHPTVKPLDLMRHLVRLVTPTGGTVLDPFAGSGTTLLAAELEGFPWVGIEREAEYVAIIEARLNGTQRGLGLPA